jgi:hypothetical protein
LFTVGVLAGLTKEFIKGFETGAMLREDTSALKDYNCPRAVVDNDAW